MEKFCCGVRKVAQVLPVQSSVCLLFLVAVRSTSGPWKSVLMEKHLSSCRKPNPKMTDNLHYYDPVNKFLCLLISTFDKKQGFSCVFVHLNKYPEQYTAIFFGFGGCNYCNTCQQGGLWATLSHACLEALEETVPLGWLFQIHCM